VITKRLFDWFISGLGLILCFPLLIIVGLLVKLTSRGSLFFKQERIGRNFRPFFIYKFRTMVQDAPNKGGLITFGDDPRITPLGRILRNTKIDELPQLINVLMGQMSLVGPRPEVRRYVELYRDDYEEILSVPPGITDLASIKYRNEATLLGQVEDPEEEYRRRVLPEKIRLAKQYVRQASFLFDLTVILKTVLNLIADYIPFSNKENVDPVRL
jgi:lipopolysaccharide/colanic/teichoic acid biosynthesis glycosyltransferase